MSFIGDIPIIHSCKYTNIPMFFKPFPLDGGLLVHICIKICVYRIWRKKRPSDWGCWNIRNFYLLQDDYMYTLRESNMAMENTLKMEVYSWNNYRTKWWISSKSRFMTLEGVYAYIYMYIQYVYVYIYSVCIYIHIYIYTVYIYIKVQLAPFWRNASRDLSEKITKQSR